jgi:hypothetical protein
VRAFGYKLAHHLEKFPPDHNVVPFSAALEFATLVLESRSLVARLNLPPEYRLRCISLSGRAQPSRGEWLDSLDRSLTFFTFLVFTKYPAVHTLVSNEVTVEPDSGQNLALRYD